MRVRRGFTLVEVMVAIAIIAVLAGLLFPVVGVLRERARRGQAATAVAAMHAALQAYAAEERRHRYPPAAADLVLAWAPPGGPPATLNLLQQQGLEVDLSGLDRATGAPHPLLDPWQRPYRYQVDADLQGAGGAQRPLGCDGVSAPLAGWNAAGRRPWGYVWSSGRDGSADGLGWIYQHDAR